MIAIHWFSDSDAIDSSLARVVPLPKHPPMMSPARAFTPAEAEIK